jgi:hypothetical protein
MNQIRKRATKFKEDDHPKGDNRNKKKGNKNQGGQSLGWG